MATIFVNGCFDLLHEGHRRFLTHARFVGCNMKVPEGSLMPWRNRLVVALNSDKSARSLKLSKWGENYPIDDLETRKRKLAPYVDEILSFDDQYGLYWLIYEMMPCVLVKGPDYAGQRVTGDLIAPVLILDTPEPESVKRMKVQVYGQLPKV